MFGKETLIAVARQIYSIGILAGGNSTRMGGNKALAVVGGRPVLSQIIDALKPLGVEMFITGGDQDAYAGFGLPVRADRFAARASLVGVYSALAASRSGLCFITACDMPFVRPELVELLLDLSPGYDAVIPVSPRGLEPLCALYSHSCLEAMREAIDRGDYSIRRALEPLHVRFVEKAELSALGDTGIMFFNINTAGDLEEAARLLEPARQGREGPAPLVCFVGKKDSGKTTFIEKLARLLVSWRLEVAYIKHDVHGFEMDRTGTDTDRLARAGAASVIISSPDAVARLDRVGRERDLSELHRRLDRTVDLIIAEGYKSSCADRIEVSRAERSRELACREEDLIAVVSDRPEAAASVPLFNLEDIEPVARFLVERYGLDHGRAMEES